MIPNGWRYIIKVVNKRKKLNLLCVLFAFSDVICFGPLEGSPEGGPKALTWCI